MCVCQSVWRKKKSPRQLCPLVPSTLPPQPAAVHDCRAQWLSGEGGLLALLSHTDSVLRAFRLRHFFRLAFSPPRVPVDLKTS